MCLLKYFWTKGKKRDLNDCGNRGCGFIANIVNLVTTQCCMKTLGILIVLVVLFCLLGNPVSYRTVDGLKDGEEGAFEWFSLFEDVEDLSRTISVENMLITPTESLSVPKMYVTTSPNQNYLSDDCDCIKNFSGIYKSLENSTCSNLATTRGPGQKIVSYSFYGDWRKNPEVARKFFNQIGERAREVAALYPGWLMRLYYLIEPDDVSGKSQLCTLSCQYNHLDLCDVTNIPQPVGNLRELQPIGRTWRFLVMEDPLVEAFISRDLDSSILKREVSAVKDWLESNRTFHIMRDHPSHNGYMMAGLWGAKNSANRKLIGNLGSTIFNSQPRAYWDFDQALLRRIVWPEAVKNSLQHDSYSCKIERLNQYHTVQPFPEEREGRVYVGWGPVKTSANRTGIVPCPKSCRPKDHPQWTYC